MNPFFPGPMPRDAGPEMKAWATELIARERMFGECEFAVLLSALRVTESLILAHRDRHDFDCKCSSCDRADFDPHRELGGLLWCVENGINLVSGEVGGHLEFEPGQPADDFRRLADLSGLLAAVLETGDFGPLRAFVRQADRAYWQRLAAELDGDEGPPDVPAVVGN